MARFGMVAVQSARSVTPRFRSQRTKALFAGLAAHSFLSLDEPLSAAFAIMMAATFGGKVSTSTPVRSLANVLPKYDLLLCDLTPRQLIEVGGPRLSDTYKRRLGRYRYGAGVFKVDYALEAPIPWKAPDCLRAATVHLGGTFEEIAASEKAVRIGQHADRPFVLLAQPSLFDSSRTPAGKHTAWAYCHVPNGSKINMLDKDRRSDRALRSRLSRMHFGTACVFSRRP
jgi:phytoene dehydrogenase-like protein